MAILFSKKFLPMSYEFEEVVQGRLLKVIARYEKSTLTLLNVYTPVNPGERCIFLEKLASTLTGCASTDFLNCGRGF